VAAPTPGWIVSKICIATNYADVYNDITPSVPPPGASFTMVPASGSGPAPLSVNFTDTSSNSPTAWSWNFGDGQVSTSENPANTYTNPGSYTAQLITSNAGGSNTNKQTVSVYDPFAWWRLQYFGSTNGASGAPGVDGYGTGMSNTNKYLAGFSTNAAAYLHVLGIARVNNGKDVQVTYLGASGDTTYPYGPRNFTNILEYTTGTTSGGFSNINFTTTGVTNLLGVDYSSVNGGTGKGTVTNMTDSGGATNIPSRYYRVRVIVP